jgi:pimeloyl-ACP methyl ester carboxylesterase
MKPFTHNTAAVHRNTPQRARRAWLGATVAAAGAAALLGGAYAAGAYRASMAAATRRVAMSASRMTNIGPHGVMEYAVAGHGTPLLMVHGTGGGFDQGLLFALALVPRGFAVVAPSRFGYLRSSFPQSLQAASPAQQADAFVRLLDHLQLDRVLVVGGSAGALPAAEFALRHPLRCSHLVMLVPAANLSGRDPVQFTPLQQAMVDRVLGSDFAYWLSLTLAPGQCLRTLLATEPALLAVASDAERQRANLILHSLLPMSRKVQRLRNDGYWSSQPCSTSFERISVPTLVVSCADDLFATAATAGSLHARMPGSRLVLYPQGGHIWLGYDEEVADEIARHVRRQ